MGTLSEFGLKFFKVLAGGKPSLTKPPALPGMQAATALRCQLSVVLPAEEVPAMN